MVTDLQLDSSEDRRQVEIDIRKILEQLGIDKERWPQEWRDSAERPISN